jgi:hypothetical protein
MHIMARCEGRDDTYFATFEGPDSDHALIVSSLFANLEEQVGGPIGYSEVEFFRCEELKLEVTYKLKGV